MPETPVPDKIVQRFRRLFRAHPDVYGRTDVAEGYDENGKRHSRSWLEKSPLTDEVWRAHLEGRRSIGCVPIKPNSMVSWGAIDVDVYQGAFNFEQLLEKITRHSLPFVVCRSKSGGGHVYLFLEKETLARKMVAKLERFAAFFGQGASEIFPKQVALGRNDNDADYGNWINMPYDGPESLRYAQSDSGARLDMDEFLGYAEVRALSSTAFDELEPPDSGELLPDGPPCLNYIFSERAGESEMRNVTLSNVAVYLKKAFPEGWQDELNKVNQKFGEPLPDRELEAIKKSYERKDYRYSCSKEPLCRYCDARKCKARRFGIGKDEIVPTNRSLTKLDTDPPIWYLTFDDKTLSLTTDQLFNFSLFNKRCLEVLNRVYQPYKQAEWLENLASIAQNCAVIEIPEEAGPYGRYHELLEEFLTSHGSDEGPEALLRGIPWETNEHFIFRYKDIDRWMEQQRFKDLARNEITAYMRRRYEGTQHTQKVKQSTAYCWKLPKTEFVRPAPFEPADVTSTQPF